MIAVPTRKLRAAGSSSRVSRHIRKMTMAMDAQNTISCAAGIWPSPTRSEITVNASPPPRIHQFTGGGSHESFAGRRDPTAKLDSQAGQTALKPGVDRLAFSFPDLDGNLQTYPDARHAGKIVLITIGSVMTGTAPRPSAPPAGPVSYCSNAMRVPSSEISMSS